jgi:hypothetical protein
MDTVSQRATASKKSVAASKKSSQTLLSRPEVRIALALAVLIVIVVVGLTVRARLMIAAPTQSFHEDLGQTHIAENAPHPAYNSNPPTSGWHYGSPASWGIYNSRIPDETLIHNLEHGGVWISYRDANDTGLLRQLEGLVSRYPDHVILTYRPENDRPVAVAAWQNLLTMDVVDEAKIFEFIAQYLYKGPECSGGRCP